jgi:hypothetical protein
MIGAPACALDFKALTSIIQTLSIPDLPAVDGWLSPSEQRTLYALAFILDGPILEIGSWVGKSTGAMARAIRDSGRYKKFVTSELNPTPDHWRPVGDGIGFFLPPDSEACLGVTTMKSWKEEMEPVVTRPGGIVGALKENLQKLNLLDLVEISVGDFSNVPRLNYRFIFSDTMHTPNEIRAGLPTLRDIIGGRSILLAAHDWAPENEKFIRETFPVLETARYDTLILYHIADQSTVS